MAKGKLKTWEPMERHWIGQIHWETEGTDGYSHSYSRGPYPTQAKAREAAVQYAKKHGIELESE